MGPATAGTLTRDLSGHASGYFEVEASSAGDKPIVLRAGSGSNLQAAVFRIE